MSEQGIQDNPSQTQESASSKKHKSYLSLEERYAATKQKIELYEIKLEEARLLKTALERIAKRRGVEII